MNEINRSATVTYVEDINVERRFMTKVYGWMTLALIITGVVAGATAANPELLLYPVMRLPFAFLILMFVQLGVVIALSARINKMSTGMATGLFLAYSALTGFTLSTIVFMYTASSIATAFFTTAGMFAAMSVVGLVIKADLSKIGMLAVMALVGVIIASLINIFLQSTALYWILTYLTVLIFVGLIAWDTQRLKRMAYGLAGAGGEVVSKSSILGALALYLDFINLFLAILRIFGRR